MTVPEVPKAINGAGAMNGRELGCVGVERRRWLNTAGWRMANKGSVSEKGRLCLPAESVRCVALGFIHGTVFANECERTFLEGSSL